MKKDMIYIHKWVLLMVAMDKYKDKLSLNRIAGKIGLTYAWAHAVFKKFNKKGWIDVIKIGRTHNYAFTTEGKKVLKISKQMIKFVEGPEHYLIKKEEE